MLSLPKTTNLISSSISTKELTFSPGSSSKSFEVTVVNNSDKFATFILEVIAAGVETQDSYWYRLSPEVCTKKPPGDSTKFLVEIFDTPIPGFVGQMNLTIRVFSIELQDESRQLLRLILQEGTGSTPLQLNLPIKEIQASPNTEVKVPVQIHNPGKLPTDVVLNCLGLPDWVVDVEKRFQILPGKQIETFFLCRVPPATQTVSQLYPFKIEANHSNGSAAIVEGNLSILPQGTVEFICSSLHHRVPKKRLSWRRSELVNYQLQFRNFSNLSQVCSVQISSRERLRTELNPELINLAPGETGEIILGVRLKRPWLGRVRKITIDVSPTLSDTRLGNLESQFLRLEVFPIIPALIAILAAILLLWLAWRFSWLNPNNPFIGHQEAVNSVQLDGLGREVVSGSNDQSLIEWDVKNFFNPIANQEVGEIGDAKKAVRVVRYKPVDNDLVAAGLENGEIQLWNLLGNKKLRNAFSYQKDDRVFALEFTQDSRRLFSGHGSGLVLEWDVDYQQGEQINSEERLQKKKQFDFAVYTMKFVGKDDSNLVLGGRYNQLVVWNPRTDNLLRLPYRPGGQDDYILSLDTAAFQPYLMATADNQGYITLWDLEKCLGEGGACEVRDRWQNGHKGLPVRSVALSDDGCYLASGGDDGRVILWSLTAAGKRDDKVLQGEEINRSSKRKKFNTVDIKKVNETILIASGSDDTQVRVKRIKAPIGNCTGD